MSLAIVYSRANAGMEAPLVTVEVHVSKGLPGLSIVGLPETAVKESRHRVRSAIINSGWEFPARRLTVNLAPADLPKEGGRFDLAIALGILAASNQIPKDVLLGYEFAGELALSGELRPIRGALSFAVATQKASRSLIIAANNGAEAALKVDGKIFIASHLQAVGAHLRGTTPLAIQSRMDVAQLKPIYPDLKDVILQARGKRALEIAAAGGHSLLFVGPPGSGKTMLATRLRGILPPLTEEEALDVARLYSLCREGFAVERWGARPFRAPHHTSSSPALVGGGNPPYPGEISLAHQGILFLDELPEFNRRVLETLREPLEAGTITISRAAHQAQFPAKCQLIAAMNPCPCGYLGDVRGRCRCTREQVARYRDRLSGPLLDRIDMHVEIAAVSEAFFLMPEPQPAETSDAIQTRVLKTRQRQYARQTALNAALQGEAISAYCEMTPESKTFIQQRATQLSLSARAFHRVLKVARTIADLSEETHITLPHLAEAISYRGLDRQGG